MARHEPTKETRQIVTLHAMVGTDQHLIAQTIGVSVKTLRKHYREELDLGLARANAVVARNLFEKAKAGDTTCMIFWLKTRAGWREKARDEDAEAETITIVRNYAPKRDDET